MAIFCPNFTSKEWKVLVAGLGSDQAIQTYLLNDSDIPTLEYAKELLEKGMITFTDEVDPLVHNNIVAHKITSNRLGIVNEFLDQLNTKEDPIVTDNSLNFGGYTVNVDTANNTREYLDGVVEREKDRLNNEKKVLEEQLQSYDKVNTYSTIYKDTFPHHSVTDLNDNPIGITSYPTDLNKYSPRHAWETVKKLTNVFEKEGIHIDTIYDFTSPDSGNIGKVNEIPTIVINPIRMKDDTVYHEFGHIYVDMIGYDSPLIKRGIKQVINTKLADAIRIHNPNLNQVQFEKEVLTTAIGTKSDAFIKNPEALKAWNFWLNRLYRSINEIINKITNGRFGEQTDVATKLAADLVNGHIGEELISTLSDYVQHQVDEPLELQRARDSALDFLIHTNKDYDYRLREYSRKPKYIKPLKDLRANVDLIDLIAKKDFNKITEAVTRVIDYELKYTDKVKNKLQIYSDMMFKAKREVNQLTPIEKKDMMDAIHGSLDFLGTASKIDNMRTITQDPIDILRENQKEDIPQEDKDDIDVYISQMENYMNTIEDSKVLLKSNVAIISQQLNDLLPLVYDDIMKESTAPKEYYYMGARTMGHLAEDVGISAKWFDSLAKSTHPLAANLARTLQLHMAIKDKQVKELQAKYYAAEKKLGTVRPDFILDNLNRITKKYDYDTFEDDFKKAVDGMYYGTPEYMNSYYAFLNKNTHRTINEDTGKEYTNDELNNIIADKYNQIGKTIDSDEYDLWLNRNFKEGTHDFHPRFTGDYAMPNDNYISKKWTVIQGNKNIKEYYDTVVEILDELADGYDIAQLDGTLAAIASKEFLEKQAKEDKKDAKSPFDDIEYIDSRGGKHFILKFQYAGKLNQLDMISIPERKKGEVDGAYIPRALSRINKDGRADGMEFSSLNAVKAENNRRSIENKKRHAEAVNTDLHVVIPMWIESAMTYRAKDAIEHELLLGQYIAETSPISKRSKWTGASIMSDVLDREGNRKPAEFAGHDSNVFKQIQTYLEMQLYDRIVKPEQYDNILRGLKNYVSFLGIGFNVFANTRNITQGGFMSATEALGGVYFNSKEFLSAMKEYMSNVPSYMADVDFFERSKDDPFKASSKENAFFKQLAIIESYNDLMEKSDDKGLSHEYFMRMISSVAYMGQEAGEHMMQNTTYLAMMHSHRLVNENGKYRLETLFDYTNRKLTKTDAFDNTPEGKLKNRKIMQDNKELRKTLEAEFLSNPKYYDLYDFNESTGYIKLKPEYKDKLTDTEEASFKLRVMAANHEIHGVYNKLDKGIIEHTMKGQLAIQFKKFARPGWTKRFGYKGGIFRIIPTWDESSQSENVGTFKALGKFLTTNAMSKGTRELFASKDAKLIAKGMAGMIKDYMKFITNVKVYWHMMSPVEQAAARKAIAEFASMGIVLALLLAGLKWKSEDDKRKNNMYTNYIIYILDAQRMELLTYVPIYGWMNQGKQILANPTATFGLAASIGNVISDLVAYPFQSPDSRMFQGGINRGDMKLWIHAKKTIPTLNILQRFNNMQAGQDQAYKMVGSTSLDTYGLGKDDSGN